MSLPRLESTPDVTLSCDLPNDDRTPAQQILCDCLFHFVSFDTRDSESDISSRNVRSAIANARPDDLAELFVSASFLASAIQPLIDHYWLQTSRSPSAKVSDETNREMAQTDFARFLQETLQRDLPPLEFLSPLFVSASKADLRKYGTIARTLLATICDTAETMRRNGSFSDFASAVIQRMNSVTTFDAQMHVNDPTSLSNRLPSCLYRAFDDLDRILGIDYERDLGMRVDPNTSERLYEGAGLGVQTSYTTILLVLDALQPKQDAHIIDLGSGYGRVGLLIGLLRPDIHFTGYEYVGHRIEASQDSANRAGLSERVQFVEQDLAALDFAIPEADVYYLYDPFTQETYRHVFRQLKDIGARRSITVVTKGRANAWFEAAVAGEGWSMDLTLDEGTIGIFRSPKGDTV